MIGSIAVNWRRRPTLRSQAQLLRHYGDYAIGEPSATGAASSPSNSARSLFIDHVTRCQLSSPGEEPDSLLGTSQAKAPDQQLRIAVVGPSPSQRSNASLGHKFSGSEAALSSCSNRPLLIGAIWYGAAVERWALSRRAAASVATRCAAAVRAV